MSERDLPGAPKLINWFTPFAGSQHAFVDAHRSLCERVRFTAKLEIDRHAPFCVECRQLARDAVGRVLDYIVDSEAEAGYVAQDLRNRMVR